MKRKPIGFCTKCTKPAYSAIQINCRCGVLYGGKRCQGTISSALNENDWMPCSFCQGEGCETCEQTGWVLMRKR